MLKPVTCRVLTQAERAFALATDLGAAMQRLRVYQGDCTDCDLNAICAARNTLNAAIDAALRDVASEWNLL